MNRFRSMRFCRSKSKLGGGDDKGCRIGKVKWELRPGGMLVQKREDGGSMGEEMITVKVSTGSHWHDISIEATSTFGELKMILSLVTNLEPREQRLLFKGKEREDDDFLHMVGVKDMDKVLLFQDPANKERKLVASARNQPIGNPCRSISV
ncbi:BAG family molecular chaperone regulator 3-like [Tasmannia lanceolata]|uniref:BAG family molecular chaperone regulator 3-like n=1 Tax=Tasmannia lanceolata TaxID=3420 RepID=UPI004063C9F8